MVIKPLNLSFGVKSVLGVWLYMMAGLLLIFILEKPDFLKIFQFLKIEHKNVVRKAQLSELNYLIPDYNHFNRYVDGLKDNINGGDLRHAEYYYQRILNVMPETAEAYYMLGFCQFKLDKVKESVESFKKSIDLNPKFFWAYYNLAVVLYQLKEKEKSMALFYQALQLDRVESVKAILMSQVFMQIYVDRKMEARDLPGYFLVNLDHGYKRAQIFSLAICYTMGQCPGPESLKGVDMNNMELILY